MERLSLEQAVDLASAALARNGAGAVAAASVAGALVQAEADGFKGHGLSRLPSYVAQLRSGKVKGDALPGLSRPRPGALLIDAGFGFAFPALDLAVAELPALTRAQGIACAAITRSHHCGSAGAFVERLAGQGLVAILFANTPAAMAPWGGSQAVFGTNPIAFAAPRAGDEPIVVDMALSTVARGNIAAAARKGEAIPAGWAFDADGQPTTDAQKALQGTMAPLGDAKGIALALMVELLAAGMCGANYASQASSFLDDKGPPPGTGQLLIAIDPTAFAANALERFSLLAGLITDQPGARLPGARRLAARAAARQVGISPDPALLAEIRAL
ncbi:Ldh family oxidoreductase [Pseudogemmobacter faecipullorum]|uniref:Ldh family oxidoreductase n=1 Tax=Pseudogemmobacter faecipullorum TaxID=2755041 RepID=A0ABS8CM27_9RHOB|nr:Ldh family oxidoreductase [Pseudogemmobacter faecipullorum]MCB5410440.1 Ldh family oxidoreductase [Pseudogemmobacter faecipullorum]